MGAVKSNQLALVSIVGRLLVGVKNEGFPLATSDGGADVVGKAESHPEGK